MSIDDIVDRELPSHREAARKSEVWIVCRSFEIDTSSVSHRTFGIPISNRSIPEKLATQSLDSSIAVQQKSLAQSVQLVVIDDADYLALFSGSSPLNPSVFSQLLMAIAAAQPRALVVDIDTSASSFAAMEVPSVPTVWAMDGEERTKRKVR